MSSKLDVLFVSPNSGKEVYQQLYDDGWTATEVPYWALLLAESCRSQGFSVAILDCLAERLNTTQSVERIKDINPKLVCFVTYGANPNAGTTQMVGTLKVAKLLKEAHPQFKTMSVGSHTSALPHDVLNYGCFDFVSYNEGVKCLHSLLKTDLKIDLNKVPALGWKDNGLNKLNNGANSLVSTEEMDYLMPGYAWDLLPYKDKPFDLYFAHGWHAQYQDKYRQPFASLYTSLGCQFFCEFCMINILNRTSIEEGVSAANSHFFRFWSANHILKQYEILIEKYGCTTIRILDELFLFNKNHYAPILQGLIDRGYGKLLKSWCYARVDTINPKFLDLVRDAGIQWLGIGIESGDQSVRQEIVKGKFKDINIRDIIKQVKEHGLNAGCNYIFGLPTDNYETMQKTYDLSVELNGEFTNYYTATALPGSPLYFKAKEKGWKLPDSFEGFSFHSYETIPLDTDYVSGAEVLKFRDDSWHKYFSRPSYHKMILDKFGQEALNNIKEQCKIRLKRKVLGD